MAFGNFAQTQLLKYGWTEGKGLGKNENGLTKALKPTLKFDKAGIGYNETNSEHWWETLYDKTVKNIKVESCNNEVRLSTIDDSNIIDGWNTVSSKKSKKTEQLKYGNFLKSSTLHNGHLIQDISLEKEEKTAKDSVYIPLTGKKLNKVHGGRIAYKTATQGVTSSLARCLEIIEQQEPRLFLDVTTSSVSPQPDASVVKENTMTHRKTDVELDTEESEDLEESQEIVDDQNTSQHEDFVIRSKKARKNDRRRLNKLTQQFNICSLKRNDIDSKYNSPHDEKLTRFKKGKDCKSQLNVKSGKCSKRKQKNRRKNSFELQIHHFKRKTASYYDIPNKLENTTENIYFFKSKKCNSSPVISSSNNSKDKADKDTYEITLPIDEDTRNINIKQEIREQKTTGWEYFNASKGDLSSIEFYNTVERMLDKKEHDKIIKKKIYQQKRVKKTIRDIYESRKFVYR